MSRADRHDAEATNGVVGAEVLADLADHVLPKLVARLEQSRLGELEVRQDGWRVRLRRNVASADGAEQPPTPAPRRSERRTERAAVDRSDGADGRPHQLHKSEHGPIAVTSPAVGYYVARDSVAAGSAVRAGDLIGHVDVLGVRHDVVAPEDGLLIGIDVEAGEAVEYGQELARLERRSTERAAAGTSA